MSREMYPSTPFVEDDTRQTTRTAMEPPTAARISPMMLRAQQSMDIAERNRKENNMASKSLYLRKPDLDEPGAYLMEKFDQDLEPLETYTLTPASSTGEWMCSCPARTTECRHVKMMPLFDRAMRGEDALFAEVSAAGRFQTFLQYDGKMFDWIRGPELPPED